MKTAHASVAIFVISALCLLFALSFSAKKYFLECDGKIFSQENPEAKSATVFIELNKYPWWARLWRKSYGSAQIKIAFENYYDFLSDIENNQAGELVLDTPGKDTQGWLSAITGEANLTLQKKTFRGICRRSKKAID